MIHALLTLAAPSPAPPSIGSVFELAVKGGILMIPIAFCSLVALAVSVERWTVLRASRVVPPAFATELEKAADAPTTRAIENARALCDRHDHPASRVVRAGLDKLGHTREVVERHVAVAGEREVYLMRRRLRALTIIASLAPLLGLTGTIFGLIRAFATVAESGDNLGRAEMLAGGIYEAMITTAAGLLVAMPTIVLYHWLAGRAERLTRDLDALAVWFVERFVLEPGPVSRRLAQPGGNHTTAPSEPAPAAPAPAPSVV